MSHEQGVQPQAEVPYLGSKISLISKAEIRYEGTLYTIDPIEATVALAKVRSFGTEDRPTDRPVAARNDIFEFIIFRGHDIKDLHICEPPQPQPTEGAPVDSAIVTFQSSRPPPDPPGAAFPGAPFGPPPGLVYQPSVQPPHVNLQPAPGYPAQPPLGQQPPAHGQHHHQQPFQDNQHPQVSHGQHQQAYQGQHQQVYQGQHRQPLQGQNQNSQGQSHQPSLGQNQPSQGQNEPLRDQNQPPQSQNKPSQGQNQPSQGQNKPSQGQNQPSQGQNKPSQGQNQSSQGQNKPSQGQNQPPHDQNKPSQGQNQHAQGQIKPSQGQIHQQPSQDQRTKQASEDLHQKQPFQGHRQQLDTQKNSASQSGSENAPNSPQHNSRPVLLPQPQKQNQPYDGQGMRRTGGYHQNNNNNGDIHGRDVRAPQASYSRETGRVLTRGVPPRGGHWGAASRGYGHRGGRAAEPLKFDTEFDFETANAQFTKESIDQELKNLSLGDRPVGGGGDEEEEEPEGEVDDAEEGSQEEPVFYDRTKSFFDNISCDATDDSKGQRLSWKEGRKLNSETFGIKENFRRNYRGRGNWRGGFQHNGGQGRWRGDGGYREGGWYSRGGGRENYNREGGARYHGGGNGQGHRSWRNDNGEQKGSHPGVDVRS